MALADQSDIARVNASNPDISAFVKQGGKLILSGGWNNALVPAGAVLDYYQRVEATHRRREHAQRAVRLYMVPGMIECNGGPAPTRSTCLASCAAGWSAVRRRMR